MEKLNQRERKYEPHKAGTFPAVCCDVYKMSFPNDNYGKPHKYRAGEIDNKQFNTKIYIVFLTTETIVKDGITMPKETRFGANMAWGDRAKLTNALTGWAPDVAGLADPSLEDLDALIGRSAIVKVEAKKNSDTGITNDFITAILPPMDGLPCPTLPPTYERRKDREARKAAEASGQAPVAAPVAQAPAENDDSIPF